MIDLYELLFWTSPIGFFMLFAPEQKKARPTVGKKRTATKTRTKPAKAKASKSKRAKPQKAKPLTSEHQMMLDNYFINRDTKGTKWETKNYGGTIPL